MEYDYAKVTYAELVEMGLKSEKDAKPWHVYLKKLRARRDAEAELVQEVKKKRPGMSRDEVLNMYAAWLNENYPVPELAGLTPRR